MSAPISRTTSQENLAALTDANVATGFAADANPTTAPTGKTTHTDDMRYRTTGSLPISEAAPHKGPALPKSTPTQQNEFTTKLAQAAQRAQKTDVAKASDDEDDGIPDLESFNYDIDPITSQKTPPKVPDNKPKLEDLLKPEDDDSENEAGQISDTESDKSDKSDKTDDEKIKDAVSRMGPKDKLAALITHAYSLVEQCNAKIQFIDDVISVRVTALTSQRSNTMKKVNAAIQQKRTALQETKDNLLLQTAALQQQALADESQTPRMVTTLTGIIDAAEKQIQSFDPTILTALREKNTAAEPRYGQLATTITGNLCKITKAPVARVIMLEAQANQAFQVSTAASQRGDTNAQLINYATTQVKDAEVRRLQPEGKK